MRITLPSLMLLTSLGGIARLPAQGVVYRTVRDPAGGSVFGVIVEADSATGPVTRTDSTGAFTLCELPPGPVRIAVGMAGFAPFQSPVIQVGASDTVRLAVRLTGRVEPGARKERS